LVSGVNGRPRLEIIPRPKTQLKFMNYKDKIIHDLTACQISIHMRCTIADWECAHGYIKWEIPEKYRALVQKSKKYCVANNIHFIASNTVPEFTDNSNTLFLDVVHPNVLRHEIIAKTIRPVIQRMITLEKDDNFQLDNNLQ
jgi:hypothetical protein